MQHTSHFDFSLILINLIYIFFSWFFCKKFIGFQLNPSIQIYDILIVFNLVIMFLKVFSFFY